MKKINRLNLQDRRWNKEHLKEKYHLNNVVFPNHVADLDYEIPQFLTEGLKIRLNQKTLSYISLDNDFYQAVEWWYKNTKNLKLEKEWISYSYGVLFSIIIFLRIWTNKYERVLINAPCYNPFVELVKNNNREVVFQALNLIDNSFEINLEEFEKIIKNEKIKVFILCNPLNPTGKIWSLETLNQLARICSENNVLLISDEVHSELTLKNDVFNSILKVDRKYLNHVVVCTGLSKLFNVGGANASYNLIPNKDLAKKYYDYLSSLWLTNANVFGSEIIKIGYERRGIEWVKEMQVNHALNLQMIKHFIEKEQLPLKVLDLESGYCVVIKMLNVNSQKEVEEFNQKLIEKGVLVRFASFFSDYDNYWFRLIISTTQEDILIFLNILKEIYRKEKLYEKSEN